MKIVFFSPYAVIDQHIIPEMFLAQNLARKGHEISVIGCDGALSNHCLAIPNQFLDDRKQISAFCKRCKINRDVLVGHLSHQFTNLDSFLTLELRTQAKEIVESLESDEILHFSFGGVAVGRFALYEFMLNHKLQSPQVPEHLWTTFQRQLLNGILVAMASRSIYEHLQPERVVTYNALYSTNRIFCAVAETFQIPFFSVHAGSHLKRRLQQLTIFRGLDFSVNRHPSLKAYRNRILSTSDVQLVHEHLLELIRGSSPWVYSVSSARIPLPTLRDKLGIDSNQKVLLAVSRSQDERRAAELSGAPLEQGSPIFRTQLEWMEWLVSFCRENPNFFVIFRVHPREFPNKREQVMSSFAQEFLSFTKTKTFPSNFFLNLPDQQLSIYDLFKITDLTLNNSSTVGLESVVLGIPVLGIGDSLYSYDEELQIEPRNTANYEELIRKLVQEPPSILLSVRAYRWLYFSLGEVSVDISSGFGEGSFFEHRIVKYLDLILRRLNIHLSRFFITLRLRKFKFAKKEHDKLVFAIENDETSHLNYFTSASEADPQEETIAIRNSLSELFREFCDKGETLDRFHSLLHDA